MWWYHLRFSSNGWDVLRTGLLNARDHFIIYWRLRFNLEFEQFNHVEGSVLTWFAWFHCCICLYLPAFPVLVPWSSTKDVLCMYRNAPYQIKPNPVESPTVYHSFIRCLFYSRCLIHAWWFKTCIGVPNPWRYSRCAPCSPVEPLHTFPLAQSWGHPLLLGHRWN